MDDSQLRVAVQQAHNLFGALKSEWGLVECETIAEKILAEARRLCRRDRDILRSNLVAAVILCLEKDLAYQEKQLLLKICQRLNDRRSEP